MSNVVDITVRATDKSGPGLRAAVRHTENLDKATKGATKSTSLWKAAGALAVGSGLVKFLKDSTAEARESQKVNAQTTAVIKSTGGAAHVTAKQFGEIATAISNKTGIDDEQIQSSENMLATFTNVRNEVGKGNDIFTQATKTVTDMSVALGQDSKNSAIQLGKALNDPIRGITALQRVGVTFTDQQKEQIKTLMKNNDIMGAQKIILKELGKEFGGSAEAQATAGDKAKTAWKNFEEEIGTKVQPVLDGLENFLSQKLLPALTSTIDWLGNHQTEVKTFGTAIASVLTAVGAYKVIDKMTGAVKGLNIAMKANPVITIIAGLIALGTWFVITYRRSEDFRNKVKGVIKNLEHAWDNTLHALDNVKHAWDNVYHAGENAVHFFQQAVHYFKTASLNIGINFIKYILNPFMTVVGAIVHGAASALGWVPGLGGKLKHARDAFDNFRRGADHALHGMEAQLSAENAKNHAEELARKIQKVRDRLYAIPKNVRLTIHARDSATTVIRKIRQNIDALRNKQIDITTYLHNVILPDVRKTYSQNATGGVWRGKQYASGGTYGPVGSIDERGPEIVRLPNGSMIYPAGQSQGMASKWGQQSGVIQLEVVGGSSDFERFIAEFIRRFVRVKGAGNVQKAFGT